jgi:hypothetical protein
MDEDMRLLTAEHEAGHAVMRLLRGLRATNIHVGDGDGLCEGTDDRCRGEDLVLVSLAGPIVEIGVDRLDSGFRVDWKACDSSDLQEARDILTECDILRIDAPASAASGSMVFLDVETALEIFVKRCIEILIPYDDLIEHVAWCAYDGYLSASDLQTIFDTYRLSESD